MNTPDTILQQNAAKQKGKSELLAHMHFMGWLDLKSNHWLCNSIVIGTTR